MTVLDELTVTWTQEDHGHACDGVKGDTDCPNQALWSATYVGSCGHTYSPWYQCQKHREVSEMAWAQLLVLAEIWPKARACGQLTTPRSDCPGVLDIEWRPIR